LHCWKLSLETVHYSNSECVALNTVWSLNTYPLTLKCSLAHTAKRLIYFYTRAKLFFACFSSVDAENEADMGSSYAEWYGSAKNKSIHFRGFGWVIFIITSKTDSSEAAEGYFLHPLFFTLPLGLFKLGYCSVWLRLKLNWVVSRPELNDYTYRASLLRAGM